MDIGTVARARWRLWAFAFTVMGSLAAGVIYLAANAATTERPDFLPSTRLLGFGLAGMTITFALYVVDTERKLRMLGRIAERERAERDRIQQADLVQREFVSMAAHELRTPLTAIKGFTRTLILKGDQMTEEKRAAYLVTVDEQADRLQRLIGDLMEVSRIDTGNVRLVRERVHLPAVVETLQAQFKEKWKDRTIEVSAWDESLPPVDADRHRLEGILINLIDNAVKYSAPDSAVQVALRHTNGTVSVAITDRGHGMSNEEQKGLFQKFNRLSAESRSDVEGTGLGLYIVKGLVEAHGGHIDVRSAPGEGSTFTVSLPAAADQA